MCKRGRQEIVELRSPLSTNGGENALRWALGSHGILLRCEWDAARCLPLARRCAVLDGWAPPPADTYLLSPTKASLSAKTRALVDFLHN